MFYLLILFLALACGQKDYRLPKIVKPILYEISITIHDDFPTTKKFAGFVKMNVEVLQETKQVILHSSNITYQKSNKFNITFEEDVEKMILTFKDPLEVGQHLFEFKYEGVLFEDMNGFYLSYYNDEEINEKQWIATTQFESVYARRAFPCFDEPEFKAQFQINITKPKDFSTLSNTLLIKSKNHKNQPNLTTDVYKTTPKMSSYLVAFIISKFKSYTDLNRIADKKFDIFGTKSMLKIAKHAYDCGQKAIDRLSKYTSINYYEAGIPKMDLVAIPDFNAGAMENWGLVTFRETDLLYDEEESPAAYEAEVAVVVTHELVHQWFGNMVTMEWWSSTWLNEGFAEYFSHYVTDMIEKKWDSMNQFIITDMHRILKTEALSGSFALTSNVSSPDEINDKFNTITYAAGASIVRMMHFILGDKPFLLGIREYLKTHIYNNTNPSDLWEALSKQISQDRLPKSIDFGTVMSSWTEQPGIPVVFAKLMGKEIVLTQKRFLINETSNDSNSTWFIPITFTTSSLINFTDTSIEWLIKNDTLTINPNLRGPSDWIIFNLKQFGFYRVLYDENLQSRLINQLKSEGFVDIDVMNRAQIVDDLFNFAQTKLIKYGQVLDMTMYLTRESDYYPWYAAITGFNYLIRQSGSNKLLIKHIKYVSKNFYESVSFNMGKNISYVDILRTELALSFACSLDHEDCIKKSIELFEGYKKGKSINPNLRSIVYCSALRKSHTTENWNFLWNKYLNATLPTEREIMLNSLACTRERNTLTQYLTKTITTNSGIRKQDSSFVFKAILTGPIGFEVGYKFFKDNFAAIIKYYDDMSVITGLITTISGRITTVDALNDFEKFLDDHKRELKEGASHVKNALETIRSNLKWPKEDVLSWLNTQYGSSSVVKVNVLVVILGLGLVWINCY
ncbi:aminopeptidase N-like [Onthophagus taurus]|uniref:aminopeptidase N-like n=1 Tax=Onthophagus taurus TaxID=166361 RepID=UPI0039BEA73D